MSLDTTNGTGADGVPSDDDTGAGQATDADPPD